MGWSWHPSEWGCTQNVLWERRAGIQNNAKFTLMFALLTAKVVAPMPAAFIIFQIGIFTTVLGTGVNYMYPETIIRLG